MADIRYSGGEPKSYTCALEKGGDADV